jgi:hypothetical protein
MKQARNETVEETELMTQYGITSDTKKVFFFEGHKYDKLDDALNYARSGVDLKSKHAPG